ncbi:MAG: polysaccharide biosynthesis protein [Proteobacteria bacterium]|nr:polysaccharide biosynthesis protein [Pseudomonadota bacterium]MBU1650499.1 polysaccharide biosynthesis protein [Pseudomonadota bacterium]
MKNTFKCLLFNKWSAFLHDLLWVPVVFVLAYLLRFNLEGIPAGHRHSLLILMIVGIVVQGICYRFFGLYRGLWRFASIPDLVRILKAVFLGTLLIAVVLFLTNRLAGTPRSILVLYPLLLTIGLSVPRMFYRWYREQYRMPVCLAEGKRVVIVGAGQAGELLVRDLRRQSEILPVAFVDDDTTKHGREIHGVRVLGNISEIAEIISELDVQEILIAMPSANRDTMQRITEQCDPAGIPFKVLPSLQELVGDQVSYGQLRPVTLEDLLGRDPVKLDIEAIAAYLKRKTILVTGGGGSIGSELCRQVAGMNPVRLVIFDQGEFNLYAIDNELRSDFPDLELVSVLGDVKNKERVDWVFKKFRPDVVFHAAAYKHVPMVELNPAEGVANNVRGSCIVADAADAYGVDRFVFISTDKAVNPANVMGTTKRIAEIYCQNLNSRSKTKYITTRFGNVLGSAGSVVPLFQRQIEKGGPVTVTHPDITRYFMTIPESVSLILQAGAMGEGGEIFVLDMGEPVLIRHLAEQMIRLAGLKPEKDIAIQYTGLRPGEKLYEELLHESEGLQPTTHDKLLLARSRAVDWQWLNQALVRLDDAAVSRNVPDLLKQLQSIVPEFSALPISHVSDPANK